MARPAAMQSTTTTITLENSSSNAAATTTLRLTLNPRKKKVTWKEGTVDNEFLDKKSSKKCCIFHKQKPFDEDSSDEDDDDDHHHHHHDCGGGGGGGGGGLKKNHDATNKYGIIVIVVIAGYGCAWWKGWKLPDMIFATKRSLSDVKNAVAKQFENVYSSLAIEVAFRRPERSQYQRLLSQFSLSLHKVKRGSSFEAWGEDAVGLIS